MLFYLLPSDEKGTAMVHIQTDRDFFWCDQFFPILLFPWIFINGIHKDHTVIMKLSKGKKLHEFHSVHSVHIKYVQEGSFKMDIGKFGPNEPLDIRFGNVNIPSAEIINAF